MLYKVIHVLLLGYSKPFSRGICSGIIWRFLWEGWSSRLQQMVSQQRTTKRQSACGDRLCPYPWYSSVKNTRRLPIYQIESVALLFNSKAFDLHHESSRADTPALIKLKSHVLAVENQLSAASQEILSLHEKLKSFKSEGAENLTSLPATTSLPKLCALPLKSYIPN